MFEWIFESGLKQRREKTQRLYAALSSLELEKFKQEMRNIRRTKSHEEILWDFTDPNKRTLLHMGVMAGDMDILKFLRRVPINAQDDRGYTALHYAAMITDSYDLVKWLGSRGINLNIQSKQGYTAYDILEAFWQEKCKRMSQDKKIDRKFFNAIFLKNLEIPFASDFSREKLFAFGRDYPLSLKFMAKHPALLEIIHRKMAMVQIGCSGKNNVDFKTFLKPHFVYFGQAERSGVYWDEVPKVSAESSAQQNKYKIWNESTLGLSKLYEEIETIQVDDTSLEQASNMVTNSVIEPHKDLNREEIDLTEENLNALGSLSISQRKASSINRFLSDITTDIDSDDSLSDYSFVSTSANTDDWNLTYQHRMH